MIRPARPDDVPTITQLVRELAEYERALEMATATDAHIHDALFGPDAVAHALMADHHAADGAEPVVAGFALYVLNFSTWVGRPGIHLEDLYVRPEFRGGGHGKALLAELAGICVERGYQRLEWNVLDRNEPAIGFYRSIGAFPKYDWTTFRLSGDALTLMGAPAAQ
jgi:ribosomal protein S18 acetylase RimI-like enzyme